MNDTAMKMESKKEFLSAFVERCANAEDDVLMRCISKLIAIDDKWSLNQIEKFLDNIQR